MGCCGGCGFGGKGEAARGVCLCGGQACASCSEFLENGVVLMTLGGPGQAMAWLTCGVAGIFRPSKMQRRDGLRQLRLTGCGGTAKEVRTLSLGGVPAQRPLNEGEDPFVAIYDVGTETCSTPSPRFSLPDTCSSCGRDRGNWVIRPCGHPVCGRCVLKTTSCTVCGNRDFGNAEDNSIVAADVVDEDTTIFHRADGSTKVHVNNPAGGAEQVVQYLASFCKGNELRTILSMLTATASFSMGPHALSEDDEVEILGMAVMKAERLVIVQLIHAIRKDVLGLGYWWHGIMSCIVRLFRNLGSFKGRLVTRENVCRALGYWKQVNVAQKTEAVVIIQAYTRGWLVRRADPRAIERNAAAVKIQRLWKRFSASRECVYCCERGARCTRCKCRGAQGRAHADCIVGAFAASGKWDGLCSICKSPFMGSVGLWVAGHAHKAMADDVYDNPDAILNMAEALVEQGSNPSINAAYRSLHGLGLELSRTDPHVLGGVVRHQEYVIRVQIQIALAEARDDKLTEAAGRLKGALAGCMAMLGLDHPLSLKVQMHIARIHFDSGEVNAAYDILTPLLDELQDTFGPNSAEALYHGMMIHAASAVMIVDSFVVMKARHYFFKCFEKLRKEFGPAHSYTLAVIRWRKAKRVGIKYTTSQQIEHACATMLQALWRGWQHRRKCFVCKKMGASNMRCGCRGRWAHADCAAEYKEERCGWCSERYTGEFGLKVLLKLTKWKEETGLLDGETWEHNEGDLECALAMATCRTPYPERCDPQNVLDEIHATNSDPRMNVVAQIVYGFVEWRQNKLESAELRLAMAKQAVYVLVQRSSENKIWWYRAIAYHAAILISKKAWAEALTLLTKAVSVWQVNKTCSEFEIFYGSVPLAYAKWKLGRQGAEAEFNEALGELRRRFGGGHDFVLHWLRKLGKPV